MVVNNPAFTIPNDEKAIAVGLSGGGDSMALAHMMCVWAVDNDRDIHLISVDHGLRDGSQSEALQVAQWVQSFPKATHHILTWAHDKKPETAVMERARNARYALMNEYCVENNIQTLVIAHHADDQIETFFFRLAKGSGLDGLTGMGEWSGGKGVKIYRPFLSYSHDDLIEYCKSHDLNWLEDTSNHDDNYARPRLRKSLQTEGFETDRFVKTLNRLSRAQEALNWMVEHAVDETTSFRPNEESAGTCTDNVSCRSLDFARDDAIVINYKKNKKYPLDIQIRVLQKIIERVGQTTNGYPPKLERIEHIVQTLKPSQSATLFGCLISLSKDGNTLEVIRS
jgi:tRNA(Ile)-lysidine synthase